MSNSSQLPHQTFQHRSADTLTNNQTWHSSQHIHLFDARSQHQTSTITSRSAPAPAPAQHPAPAPAQHPRPTPAPARRLFRVARRPLPPAGISVATAPPSSVYMVTVPTLTRRPTEVGPKTRRRRPADHRGVVMRAGKRPRWWAR